jgi:hypothetical protein
MASGFMTGEEEQLLRTAIREAFGRVDWEGDLAFLIANRDFQEAAKEGPLLQEFQVMVLDEGAAVVVPARWEEEPYLKELLQGIAAQELSAYLGIRPD